MEHLRRCSGDLHQITRLCEHRRRLRGDDLDADRAVYLLAYLPVARFQSPFSLASRLGFVVTPQWPPELGLAICSRFALSRKIFMAAPSCCGSAWASHLCRRPRPLAASNIFHGIHTSKVQHDSPCRTRMSPCPGHIRSADGIFDHLSRGDKILFLLLGLVLLQRLSPAKSFHQ